MRDELIERATVEAKAQVAELENLRIDAEEKRVVAQRYISELEKRCAKYEKSEGAWHEATGCHDGLDALRMVEGMREKIAELEKRLAEQAPVDASEAQIERLAVVVGENGGESLSSAEMERIAKAMIVEFAKQTASRPPVDATGKTPGQVSLEGRTFARIDTQGLPVDKAIQWSMLEDDERLFEEIGAEAVLRAFGGEALRRVRDRIHSMEVAMWQDAVPPALAIIDDELAKLNEPHR